MNDSKVELLPKRTIELGGALYHIHGLLHGNSFVNLSSSYKTEVANELKECNPLCEDGFASWIPNSVSMNEVEYFV